MSDTNILTVSGNLTRDAELKHTNSGKPVLNFSIANNTRFGNYEQTSFFDCCIFGEWAEKLAPHLTKGKAVIAAGQHVQSVWQDRETGKERRKFELKIRDLNFQRGNRDGGERQERPEPTHQGNQTTYQKPSDVPVGRGSEDGDDIPF